MSKMSSESDYILEVEDLEISISNQKRAVTPVKGVSFKAKRNRILAIVGESGSGKSLTARAIMRLLPESSTSIRGTIRYSSAKDGWLDIHLLKQKSRMLRQLRGGEISLIFQESLNCLNPVYTIGYQITEAIREHTPEITSQEAEECAESILEKFEIYPAAKRMRQYPHELSGGMRQRILIALAIATKPRIVIADEPTTALDVTIQAQVLKHLKSIQASCEMSLLLITHDLGLVAEYADDVVVFHAGTTVENASVDDIFSNPKHPYTQYLLNSVIPLSSTSKDEIMTDSPREEEVTKESTGCPFYGNCPKRTEQCRTEEPPVYRTSTGGAVRCWLYEQEAKP